MRYWLVLTVLIIFYCLDYFFRISTSLIVPELMQQYSADSIQIASFASAFYVGYVLMQIPAGFLLDRVTIQKTIIPAILLCTLAFLLFIFSHQFWLGYTLRLLIGATSAFSFISILYVTRHYLPVSWFATISGITIAMGTLSASMVEFISALFMQTYDWHLIFTVFALGGIGLGVFLMLPRCKLDKRAVPLGQYQWDNLLALCRNKAVIINGMIGGLFYLPTTLFVSLWGIPFLATQYQVSNAQASLGITFLFAGWAIGSPLVGHWVGRLNRYSLLVASASLLAAVVSIALLCWHQSAWPIVLALLFLFGLFSSAQVIVWQIFKLVVPKELAGIGASYTNMLILSFGAFFHLLVGYLVQHSSASTIDYQQGLLIIPVIFLTVCVCSFSLPSSLSGNVPQQG